MIAILQIFAGSRRVEVARPHAEIWNSADEIRADLDLSSDPRKTWLSITFTDDAGELMGIYWEGRWGVLRESAEMVLARRKKESGEHG